MEQDEVVVRTNVTLRLIGPDGVEKERREVHNVVKDAGLQGLIDQLLATPTLAKPGWMEVGTGTGGTTKLNAYVADSRVAFTSKTRGANAICTMVGDFDAGVGTGTLTEAGIFGIVTQDTGPMWCYATFGAITKGALDTLSVSWTLSAADDGI
jgi:hypothetical protein